MSERSLVRFGVFELDGRTGELRKHGVRLKIQDQPFRVLQALLERPGELVTREELQGKIWAQDTYVDFDQSLNRAINKVRDVLNDTAGAPRFIETLPRRGYRFIAPVEEVSGGVTEQTAPPPEQTAIAARSSRRLGWVAAFFLAIAGSGVWLARDREPLPPPRVVPLTTSTGSELFPAFSPDGKQVAFTWDGESADNRDLYVKVVGDETALRLTTDPGLDGFPAWSPDGRQIAFTSQRDGGGIYVVSPVGGPQRRLTGMATVGRPSWSADGKYLLVAQRYFDRKPEPGDGALFLVPVSMGGDPRPILTPSPGTWYKDPAYSPDGRSVAFVACTGHPGAPTCTLLVSGLRDGLVPDGVGRPIQQTNTVGLAWTKDGASLIYGSGSGGAGHLWRVDVRNPQEGERLELAGSDAAFPALDFNAGRLAFHRSIMNIDVWRMERGAKPSPFLTSSLLDGDAQSSPDGRRIAFASSRQGDRDIIAIWVANADGTGVTQVTRIASARCGSPRWSPDGKRIAFDALGKVGGWDIWVVDANGGSPRQVTHGPADNAIPSWSADGSSIYFASKRSGRFEIWRVPAGGGAEEQITRNGGYVALASTDGKTLYYTVSQAGTEGVYAKGLQDGDERQVVKEQVAVRGLAVFEEGLYYIHHRGKFIHEIRFHKSAGGRDEVIGEVEGELQAASGLAVSPDRKTFLFSRVIRSGSDLTMIENFK